MRLGEPIAQALSDMRPAWRWVFCLVLAVLAILMTQIFAADRVSSDDPSLYDFSNRKATPKPPEVNGWVLLRVCSVTGRLDHRYTEWAYIKPSFIVAIGNPPTSPDPCVAIHGANGKRLFVSGRMAEMARYIADAQEAIGP